MSSNINPAASGRRPPPSGVRGLPQTGTRQPMRIATGMAPGTGRPGSRVGTQGIGALGAQIKVAERPVTQQGLGGMKTSAKGPNRQVQDKSYFLGLLRGKIQELTTEIHRMTREIETFNQENTTYLSFEKRAESLADQIRELQGEMADYNTLMDKVNTDTEVVAILSECSAIQMQNDVEARKIDTIFDEKHEREAEIRQIEIEIDQEQKATETMVRTMDLNTAATYQELQEVNRNIEKECLEKQDTLSMLTNKVAQLKEDVSSSEIKQEAFRLHQQLSEAIKRRDEWREKDNETPQKERERLLEQVKTDNQEIASIEKRIAELNERLIALQDQLRQADGDLEDLQGERSIKYKELKKREKTIKEFLDSFEGNKRADQERICNLESNIVTILEHITQNMTQSEQLPSVEQFEEMQANLLFKVEEREKSEATAKSLDLENSRLEAMLKKVEDLENKITIELETMKKEIQTMTDEISVFCDLQGLQEAEKEKKLTLTIEKEKLFRRKETAKERTKQLTSEYEAAKAQLEDNDTYTQLGNLEKKWQHHEQNNFVMKEFISTRQMEGNYQQLAVEVNSLMTDYNNLLRQSLSGVPPPVAP